ncbi:Uncharacterised protein [Vibrio cholerae]|nr:Uncharacterised protein [Vibrio cholerae]
MSFSGCSRTPLSITMTSNQSVFATSSAIKTLSRPSMLSWKSEWSLAAILSLEIVS